MFITLLIVTFSASQVACSEIADNLRQQYVDLIDNTTQLFTNLEQFVNATTLEISTKIDQEYKELENQKRNLTHELEVSATGSRNNDSVVRTCLSSAEEQVSKFIEDEEMRLQEISMNENNSLNEVITNIKSVSDEVEDYVKQANDLIGFCDGVYNDYDKDLCFSEQYPRINGPVKNITNKIDEQLLAAQQVFSMSEENLNKIKDDITEYIRTGLEETRQQLTICIENSGSQE